MDKKCSKCGGELVSGALFDNVSHHQIVFMQPEELNKVKKNKVGVVCDACTQCGCIENLRVEEPENLRKD